MSQYPQAAQTSRRYTDDSSTERNVAAEVDVTRDSQMVQLDDVRDLLEPLLELGDLGGKSERSFRADRKTHLFEVIAEFDDGDGIEDP